ncbi:MAG: GNAT family N-acetyltransferase [Promethearchaeota archaeon]
MTSSIEIKESKKKDLLDFLLFAGEFKSFIENLINSIPIERLFILSAYCNNSIAGILISEDKSQNIDSLETLIPTARLHLIQVNQLYQNKGLGTTLLKEYLKKQQFRGIATINIKIPRNYKKGKEFLLNNGFRQKSRDNAFILFKYNLWNDFGIRDSVLIGEPSHYFLD